MIKQQILDSVKTINYVSNTKTGEKFKVFLNICRYFYDIKSLSDLDSMKMELLSQYKIIYDIFMKLMPDKSDIGRIFKPDIMTVVTPEFTKMKSDEICKKLLSYYKFTILTELIESSDLIKYVVEYYLVSTHIGGVEKRGWDENEKRDIISFAKSNPEVIEMYAEDSIMLGYDGFLHINNKKKFDNFGKNVHASYSMYKIESGIRRAELEHQQLEFDKSVSKGVHDFLQESLGEIYDTLNISINFNECIRPCDKRVWPNKWSTKECACPVKKKGWLGEYVEIEKCSDRMCKK